MPRGQYVGKRSNITFPVKMHKLIQQLAKDETRNFSNQVVRLCEIALTQLGYTDFKDDSGDDDSD